MILEFKIENTPLTLDTTELPLNDDFESLFGMITESSFDLETLLKLAYVYSEHYEYSLRIIETCIKNTILDEKEKCKAFLTALRMKHNLPDIFSEDEMDKSLKVNKILLGFKAVKRGDLGDAENIFSEISFDFGVSLCSLLKGKHQIITSKDLNEYCNTKLFTTLTMYYKNPIKYFEDLKNTLREFSLKDLQYAFGFSEDYDDAENVDVKIETARRMLGAGKLEEACTLLEKIKNNKESSEIYYLLGKCDHLRTRYSSAIKNYKKGLMLDKNNILCHYNLQRIVKDEILSVDFISSEFNDFIMYQKYLRGITDLKLDKCSEDMKKVLRTMVLVKQGLRATRDFKELINNPLIDESIVCNNYFYFLFKNSNFYEDNMDFNEDEKKAIEMMKINIERANEVLKDVMRYNLAYVQKDLPSLKDLPLVESKILVACLEEDYTKLSKDGLAYLEAEICYRNGDNLTPLKMLSRSHSLYSNLRLGTIHLKMYLNEEKNQNYNSAIVFFSKSLSSFYAANGIAVLLSLKKKFDEALRILYSVVTEDKAYYQNICNVNILAGNYVKAIREFIKRPLNRYSSYMVEKLCRSIDDVDLVISCYNKGLTQLRRRIFDLLVNEDRLDEARSYIDKKSEMYGTYTEKIKNMKTDHTTGDVKRKALNDYRQSKGFSEHGY